MRAVCRGMSAALSVCILSTFSPCRSQETFIIGNGYAEGSEPVAPYPLAHPRMYVHEPLELPVCPSDGYPNCENCRHGYAKDDLIRKNCCWDHYYAYTEKKPLREFGWYRFFGTSNIPPLYDRYRTVTNDPCTQEPMADISYGPYIPPSKKKELKPDQYGGCTDENPDPLCYANPFA